MESRRARAESESGERGGESGEGETDRREKKKDAVLIPLAVAA